MTDVNVTEKVARALYPSVFDPSGRCWQHFGQTAEAAREDAQGEAMDEARKALAVLSDPEVLAGMAGVLVREIYPAHDPDECCDEWQRDHAERVAAALADWLRGQG